MLTDTCYHVSELINSVTQIFNYRYASYVAVKPSTLLGNELWLKT